jgi:hypothetical protein
MTRGGDALDFESAPGRVRGNVTMEGYGALRGCRYLLHDRDAKYTQSFRAIIASGRVYRSCCRRAART